MRFLGNDGVELIGEGSNQKLEVSSDALRRLSYQAFADISHLLRATHLEQLQRIIDDPEASDNDKYVALDLLQNAVVSAGKVFPMCQDTGTAIVIAKRGHLVESDGFDAKWVSKGAWEAYQDLNLRYSMMAPISVYEEINTGDNMPAHVEISLAPGDEYEFLFMAKGGGSANKSFLFQENKALLDESRLLDFLREKLSKLGTAACPPYHIAVVIGGMSAEHSLKTAKLASARYLDDLPERADGSGKALRDRDLERKVFELTADFAYGAQFGGKYYCHDVRVIRLPRHGGSLPIAVAVSCSADRQVLGLINRDGIFLEQLETEPARFLPDEGSGVVPAVGKAVKVNLDAGMDSVLSQLDGHPVGTRLSLDGTLIVGRDIAHARIRDSIESGGQMPDYLLDYPIYYAGPAKTPAGAVAGSFGPTTAARMDSYTRLFQSKGGSLVMLGKGNRSNEVSESCKAFGGFYLGTIGGPAARLAQDCITGMEVVDFEELGMEAIFRIEVKDFPAFIVVDNHGNDFFRPTRPTVLQLQTSGSQNDL